jgi:hypothetical protein
MPGHSERCFAGEARVEYPFESAPADARLHDDARPKLI